MIRRENHQTWLDKRERERKEDEKKQKRLDESPLFKETGGGVPKTVQLKLGAQVMLTKNLLLPMSGREHEALVNGSRGVVVNVVQTQEAMFHIQQELVRVRTRLYERERLDAALFKYSIAEVDMLEDTLRTLEKAAHQESFDYDYMHGDEDSDDDWIRNEAYYWRQDLLNEADRAFAEAREAEREADALEEEERARAQAWLEQMKKQGMRAEIALSTRVAQARERACAAVVLAERAASAANSAPKVEWKPAVEKPVVEAFGPRAKKAWYPVVRFNSRSLVIVPTTFESHIYQCGTAYRTQIPLRLAWALTIHKAQGQTLDRVFVDLEGCHTAGQAYVALSRARTADGLQVRFFSKKVVVTDQMALRFHTAVSQGQAAFDRFIRSVPLWYEHVRACVREQLYERMHSHTHARLHIPHARACTYTGGTRCANLGRTPRG